MPISSTIPTRTAGPMPCTARAIRGRLASGVAVECLNAAGKWVRVTSIDGVGNVYDGAEWFAPKGARFRPLRLDERTK
jgi:hypothetical protein